MRALLILMLIAFSRAAVAVPPPADRTSCIDATQIAGRESDGSSAITFRMNDGTRWRNDLGGPCPGLSQVGSFKVLTIEQNGSYLCRGDLIGAVDQTDFGSAALTHGPRCPLRDFTRLPPEPRRAKR